MDKEGDKIRALMGGSFFDEQTSNDIASYRTRCMNRNLRGECANPNLQGENGMMSWDEYDRIKASGRDPREVSHKNLNPSLQPSPYGPRNSQFLQQRP